MAAVVGGATGQLIEMALDGQPVSIPTINTSYVSWSPRGDKLVYADEDRDLYILDIVSKETQPTVGASEPDVIETMPSWSADGQTIAFVRSEDLRAGGFKLVGPCDIYTIPVTGGVANPLPDASGNGFNYYPAYSPDGKWLAFTHHEDGSGTYADRHAEIYLIPAHGGVAHRIEANDDEDGQPIPCAGNSWPSTALAMATNSTSLSP